MKVEAMTFQSLMAYLRVNGVAWKDVKFQMPDGLPVTAFFIEKVGGQTMVIVSDGKEHGYGQ